jgi:hypothetical protein
MDTTVKALEQNRLIKCLMKRGKITCKSVSPVRKLLSGSYRHRCILTVFIASTWIGGTRH